MRPVRPSRSNLVLHRRAREIEREIEREERVREKREKEREQEIGYTTSMTTYRDLPA